VREIQFRVGGEVRNIWKILERDLKICLGDQSIDVRTTLKHGEILYYHGAEYEHFFLLGCDAV
jgi:hypothetical protein